MICPACKKSDTKVIDSRDEDIFVRRRRGCLKCKYRFTTFEKFYLPKLKIIKRDGTIQDYSRDKLARGIKLALEKRPFTAKQIEELITDIEHSLLKGKNNELMSKEIGNTVIKKLKEVDDVAYLRFVSVFKKFGSAKKFRNEAAKLSN